MKRFLPYLVLLLGVLYLGSTLRERAPAADFDLAAFGRLPVLSNGRLKPLDTVARSSLLQFQGRQRISNPATQAPLPGTPAAWLADVFFAAAKADRYPTFRIDSPEVLTLMGLSEADTKVEYESTFKQAMALVGFLPSHRSRFSFDQLRPRIEELERQSQLAQNVDAQARTPFQRAVVQLHYNLLQYHQLKHAVMLPGANDFLGELMRFQQILPAGIAAVRAREAGDEHNEAAFQTMIDLGRRYDFLSQSTNLLPIPPPPGGADPNAWKNTGRALLDTFETGRVDPTVLAYAGLGHAWRHAQPEQFNEILRLYRAEIQAPHGERLAKSDAETRFNSAAPFYSSMVLYVLAFLFAVFSWLKWPDVLGRSAFWLTALAFVVTTAGIATRMWLEGRPPVTNLYSSALFVGWGAVGLCLVLEAIYKNAVGSVAAGLIGFGTLLIAHHLSLSGDTLEMMRAVLDSNFWLATHVIVITIGYSATFLAGFLAIIYVVRGVLTSSLDRATGTALDRMVYGIVCFGTLFSLIGTVLGGIWADQSWGRFWGWDPKENGALIIVLWNAIILHARWGGLVRTRGLMNLAIFGNIITSWSWFGTNMLGIGLHSYGFMDAAFWALSAFIASQLALIAIGCLPPARWRSAARLKA
ncbi:MAG: cytochrome c biogenesis protein CcsA [Opitutaceae bacterium]|nr:cytochrome c biogenesis protein CcsA [Opitutaceae bacterium]